MIDIHCHILPGLDDGAQTLEDSIEMARSAVKQGISHILCTPHHKNGTYTNPADQVIESVATLQKELDARGIPLSLYEGQEVRVHGELIKDIQEKQILFADLSNRYLLVEFPTRDIPVYVERLFFDLINLGHTPVIVHPERNYQLMEEPNKLLSLIEMGALTQVTAASYLGIFGKKVQGVSKQMVQHQMIHTVASDAHNTEKRGFYLKRAYEQIAKDFGQETVNFFMQTAKDIMNGDAVALPQAQEIKKKKFGLF